MSLRNPFTNRRGILVSHKLPHFVTAHHRSYGDNAIQHCFQQKLICSSHEFICFLCCPLLCSRGSSESSQGVRDSGWHWVLQLGLWRLEDLCFYVNPVFIFFFKGRACLVSVLVFWGLQLFWWKHSISKCDCSRNRSVLANRKILY